MKHILMVFIFLAAAFVGGAKAQKSDDSFKSKSNQDAKQNDAPIPDVPAQITKRPELRFNAFETCFRDGAPPLKSILRVMLKDTGKIGAVKLVRSSGCTAFDDETIRVARLIKFKPALKDGQLITDFIELEYRTSLSRLGN